MQILTNEALANEFDSGSYETLVLSDWKSGVGKKFAFRKEGPARESYLCNEVDSDAVVYFTSGSTGMPKGVVLTFRELYANVIPIAHAFDISFADRFYDYRSLNWASAQILAGLVPLSQGATLLLRKKFSATHFFREIATFKATIAAGNPTIFAILQKDIHANHSRLDLTSLRFITSSSAPLSVTAWEEFEKRFKVRVAQGYGMSEAGWISAQNGEARRVGTAGIPLSYQQLTVVGTDGNAVPAEAIGEIEIGPSWCNKYRYLADDGEIRVSNTGRLRTGDIGYLDSDGYLHLTGRVKEIILKGGLSIHPREIEQVIYQHGGVLECVVFGWQDAVYGEAIVAVVVLDGGKVMESDAIVKHCQQTLPRFKWPEHIVAVETIPKNLRSKVDKEALLKIVRDRIFSA